MNYIGSKKTLLKFLEKSIHEITGTKNTSFLDLFAGTGTVAKHFKKLGYKITANDFLTHCYILNKNYIENNKPLAFENLNNEIPKLKQTKISLKDEHICNFLNKIEPKKGFIYNNYCISGEQNKEFKRQYFSDENGKKIDAIRTKIEIWKIQKKITENEYFFLLASLIENTDKVANTASVYGAFLKNLKKTAQQKLLLKPAKFNNSNIKHKVYNKNIENIITKIKGDILYLDPPYNHRQYAPNYHILETIAKYDNPKITGKTGLRNYQKQKSKFSQKKYALEALENIILKTKTKYIFLSYNNEGIINHEDIKKIMAKKGKSGLFEKKYPRFKADKNQNRKHKAKSVTEYLFYTISK